MLPPSEHARVPSASPAIGWGQTRMARRVMAMALVLESCAVLVASALWGMETSRQHRSEAGVVATAAAVGVDELLGGAPAPAPSAAALARVARALELVPELGGVASESELPLCDLADMSVAVPPGSCSGAPAEHAEAAPSPEPSVAFAPMCDPSAASVAAASEVPEIDRGRFEPLPCDGERWLALLRSPARESGMRLTAGEDIPRPSPQPSAPPLAGHESLGAVAAQLEWPERTASSTLAATHHRGLAWQPGHPSRVYRPPSI
jgi:hypothetical protein